MKIMPEDVSRITNRIIRLANKYKRLDSKALNFGTGDLLFPSEIHIIEAIGKNYGSTVNELCRKFSVTKGAVSQIVNKLTKKRLLSKKRNPDFHKEIILSLTERGKKAFEGHERLHRAMDEELYRKVLDFKKEDIESFEAILQRVETHIEKYIDYGNKT